MDRLLPQCDATPQVAHTGQPYGCSNQKVKVMAMPHTESCIFIALYTKVFR